MNIIKEKNLVEITPVSNQLFFPTCVSNSVCDAIEYSNKDGVELSRLFVFWNTSNNGTSLPGALDISKNIGIPPESMWEYTKDNFNIKPIDTSFIAASNRKFDSFSLILTKNEIISTIDAGFPIIIGMTCPMSFNEFKMNEHGTFITSINKDYVFTENEPIDETFQHAMLIVGYKIFDNNKCQFRIRNSWGKDWMDNGYCWFESEYVINNVESLFAITKYKDTESIISKRNLEFVISITLTYILALMLSSHKIYMFLITAIITCFIFWRRFIYNKSVIDEMNIFKLLISFRNLKGNILRIPFIRKTINFYLS